MSLINFFKEARVAVATIFLIVTLICITIGGVALALLLSMLIYLGINELVIIMKAKGFNPSKQVIFAVTAILIVFASLGLTEYLAYILTMGIIASFLTILARGQKATIGDTATTIMAILYGGWLPLHMLLLRGLDKNGFNLFHIRFCDGLGYVILIFFVITISDIAGYYIGCNFGKTPLWPEVSPKKTLEGSIASTVGGTLIAVLLGHFIQLDFWHSLSAGLLFSLAAQLGDLFESMLKRDAGFKDSGAILPGHGGVLDRADSYVLTVAVAYYFFKLLVI